MNGTLILGNQNAGTLIFTYPEHRTLFNLLHLTGVD
jgi:hypothetical protein